MEQVQGVVIGNIILVEDDASGNLLAYRKLPGSEQAELLAAFPSTEQGVVLGSLFAGYVFAMFGDMPITQELAERAGQVPQEAAQDGHHLSNDEALAEINKLGLFGKPVELA